MIKAITTLILLSICLTPANAMLTDDFVDETLSKDLQIRKYSAKIIVDEFAEANKNEPLRHNERVVVTEILPTSNKTYKINPYKMSRNEVAIRIIEPISTKLKPEEGSEILFETVEQIKIGNKIYPNGTSIKARIETVSQNAMWGSPAEIVIGNFYLDNIPLYGEIDKVGRNNVLWVRPLAILTGLCFGTGFFFMFIRGGHAKIKPNETFTLSY